MTTNARIRAAAIVLLVSVALGHPCAAEGISLKAAVDQAIKCNPTIIASELAASAAGVGARGAKALVNPELLVAPSVIGTAGSDSAVLFTQPLEITGSRKARSRVAAREAAAVGYDSETVRRDTILSVKQLYWDIVRAQQVAELNRDNIAYLDALDKAVRKQADVGSIPRAQVMKTEVEMARARQELAQAELDLDVKKAALSALIGRSGKEALILTDPLVFSAPVIDAQKLLATALRCRPEALSASAQLSASSTRITAARVARLPDIALQARKESFDDSVGGVAIAVTLPVLDWGSARAEIRRAELTTESRRKQLDATRNAVALDVEQAILAVRTAGRVVGEYQGGILDKSAQLATMAQKGYEKGATSYLEVLEAQRTLRGVRTEYLSALADHAKAIARLEWAANADLSSGEARK